MPNRKIPLIHPSKLKNQIFGDTSKMFKTPIAIDASRSGAGTSQQHNRQQQHRRMAPPNQSLIRATDTNRTMALQILQVYIICTRRAVMCSRAE